MVKPVCGVKDKRFVSSENPEGICQREPVANSNRCAMHGGLSTGPVKHGLFKMGLMRCGICEDKCKEYQDDPDQECIHELRILEEESSRGEDDRWELIAWAKIIFFRVLKSGRVGQKGYKQIAITTLETIRRFRQDMDKTRGPQEKERLIDLLGKKKKKKTGETEEPQEDWEFRIFHPKYYVRASCSRKTQRQRAYVDEIARYAWDTYVGEGRVIDAIIRWLSWSPLHETLHLELDIGEELHYMNFLEWLLERVWNLLRVSVKGFWRPIHDETNLIDLEDWE